MGTHEAGVDAHDAHDPTNGAASVVGWRPRRRGIPSGFSSVPTLTGSQARARSVVEVIHFR